MGKIRDGANSRAHLGIIYDVLDKLQNSLRNNLPSTEPGWESKTLGTSEYSTALTLEQQHITEGLVKLWLLENIFKQLKTHASLMPDCVVFRADVPLPHL